MIPGLLSSIYDKYHHTLIEEANMHGYDWAIINYRGINHPQKTGKPFSAMDFDSFKEPLKKIMEANKHR